MAYLRLAVGDLQANCYLFFDPETRECLVIDPGADAGRIAARIAKEKLLPRAVVLTHGHPDHMGAAAELMARFAIPLWIHGADEDLAQSPAGRGLAALFAVATPPAAARRLAEGDCLQAGRLKLTVLHAPGHSPGSILLLGEGLLFSGDTLFRGDIGRTDLPGGDDEQMRASLERIAGLPPELVVLPGHGEASRLQDELRDNPCL